MAPSNRSFVVFFLSTALVLRPAANSRVCLLESKNERICIKHSRQGSTNGPTKSTGTNKIKLGKPVDFVPHPYHHYIICSTSSHFPIMSCCLQIIRSSWQTKIRRLPYGQRAYPDSFTWCKSQQPLVVKYTADTTCLEMLFFDS